MGPGTDVAVSRQSAGRSVLRDQRRHAGSVHDLRRPAGQRPLVRAERHAHPHRHLEPRQLQHRQRRRVLRADRSGRSANRVHRVAGRAREPREPRDARTPAGRAASARTAEEGRARALELEHADRDVRLRSEGDLHRIEHGVPFDRSRLDLEADQPRSDGARRPRSCSTRAATMARCGSRKTAGRNGPTSRRTSAQFRPGRM